MRDWRMRNPLKIEGRTKIGAKPYKYKCHKGPERPERIRRQTHHVQSKTSNLLLPSKTKKICKKTSLLKKRHSKLSKPKKTKGKKNCRPPTADLHMMDAIRLVTLQEGFQITPWASRRNQRVSLGLNRICFVEWLLIWEEESSNGFYSRLLFKGFFLIALGFPFGGVYMPCLVAFLVGLVASWCFCVCLFSVLINKGSVFWGNFCDWPWHLVGFV